MGLSRLRERGTVSRHLVDPTTPSCALLSAHDGGEGFVGGVEFADGLFSRAV